MSADRPLQTRDSEEYARARSLIQNAMDAVRHLSHLTQIFSSLVIPLGDEPPRNLNIINTRPHQTLSNFIIPSREYFATETSKNSLPQKWVPRYEIYFKSKKQE